MKYCHWVNHQMKFWIHEADSWLNIGICILLKSQETTTVKNIIKLGICCASERINETTKAVESLRSALQSKLASLGTFPPHIVDIDWKLSYQVRVSMMAPLWWTCFSLKLHESLRSFENFSLFDTLGEEWTKISSYRLSFNNLVCCNVEMF